MYPHFIRTLLALLTLLVCSAAHATIPAFDGYAAASDEELDKMRGGFEFNFNGMQLILAFSLEQLTYINGELVSSMKLNPLQLIPANPAAGTAVAGAPAPTGGFDPTPSVNTPAGTTQTEAASTAATQTGLNPGSSTSNTSTTETAQAGTPSTVTTQMITDQAIVNLVQNGAGNSFTLPASLSSLATVIQNTVNDQVIRNLTVLNATLSIRAAAAAMQLGAALNQAIAASAH